MVPAAHATIRYRPDIDGLRAVAVLAVVGYHAAPSYVPGGFVGVDIFFVISGFLISSLLFAERSAGRIDLAGFYLRRIRRLFPALIVVLVATWLLGWWMLSLEEYRELEKHIASASVFVSNVTLWSEVDYFDTTAAWKPLLHLWSLGIEEQFYLFWPALLALAWRRRLNVAGIAAASIAVSFALNVAIVGRSAETAFFLPHTRLWQLMVGALVAYAAMGQGTRIESNRLSNVKAWTGFALVAGAIVGLNDGIQVNQLLWWNDEPAVGGFLGVTEGHAYPGVWAVMPTLGTALMISAGSEAFINRIVMNRSTLVGVGLVSYPLYLWHWPLLSFLRLAENGIPSKRLRAVAVVIAMALAVLTYLLVERPVRRSLSERSPRGLLAVAAALLAVGTLAFLAWRTDTGTSRHPQFATDVDRGYPERRFASICRARFPVDMPYCEQFAESPPAATALVGDSHAWHFFTGVGTHLTERGENVVLLGQHSCPPADNLERRDPGQPDRCRETTRSLLEMLEADRGITRVILSFRGAAYVNETGFSASEPAARIRVGLHDSSVTGAEAVRIGLERTLGRLLDHGKEVWLFHQIPELGFNAIECVSRPVRFERQTRFPCTVPRAAVVERQRAYRSIVAKLSATFPALRVFDPLPSLCDERSCAATHGGTLLYRDDHHLSRAGSLFFAGKFGF